MFLTKARGFLGLAAPESAPAPATGARKPTGAAHHAVSIVPGSRCCEEARQLRGKRFLSREAPQLPLKTCGRADCACRYEHHPDRRGGARRLADMGVAVDGWIEVDKRTRSKRGRRKGDQAG
jgi:hypothetical protein